MNNISRPFQSPFVDKKTLTRNTHKLLGLDGHQLLLEQARATTLDQIQLLVNLICTVKAYIQLLVTIQVLDVLEPEAGCLDQLTALIARREEGHLVRDVLAQCLESLDDKDDGGPGADANQAVREVHVLLDGLVGGGPLG